MSFAYKIASNTFYQLAAKVISILSTVVATALITRSLGISSFGTFFLMTGFATYFFLLVDFGINTVATKEITRDPTLTDQYFRNVLSLRLIYSIGLVMILTVLLPFIPFKIENAAGLRLGIFIGLLTIISQAIYNSCAIIFQSTLNYQKAITASLIGNISFLILAVFITTKIPNILYLVSANTLGTYLVSLTALSLVRKYTGGYGFISDFGLWIRLLKSALPLGLTVFLTVIVSKADAFLLSVIRLPDGVGMKNDTALGYYGLAYKIFENILVFPTYFVNALFPVLVNHHREGVIKLRQTLVNSLILMTALSFIALAGGYLFSPWAVFILSGQGGESPAVPVLRLLLLGLPLFFCSAVLMFFLIAGGRERFLPWVYSVSALMNIVLNLIFIPRYGIYAPAIITGATELLILLFLVFLTVKYLKSA